MSDRNHALVLGRPRITSLSLGTHRKYELSYLRSLGCHVSFLFVKWDKFFKENMCYFYPEFKKKKFLVVGSSGLTYVRL